ncbi:RNA polymerase sigma factor, sigma-70 family [Asanoa hainanensis]|uniref:RNA polymerase sigma factor, sigma-70 family n=1 Tax=Asanoa hainanensis TaxID=560556 RepID=A0A239K490_9ACTN|nr:sigma-70 family RNA polymerase sigma factor [Asanoa hainanensis]SNT12502.1 RNA polymerase sigma factor, sigma-70 family [Asanoa hainanensis]
MDPVESVWKLESARIVAALTRLVRDVGLAEDLAQDALLAALEEWPAKGVPANPGGWLMLTAKHRAIDRLRRDDRLRANLAELGRAAEHEQQKGPEDELDDDIGDDVLRLIFIACHPVLSRESSVALTLRMIGGLTTAEIARAFLVPEPTIGQRISRAKRTLGERKIPFEVPPPDERAGRLSAVLETIYLIFNEGYAATAGDDWMRPALATEAIRLGRMLAALAPGEPEVHGLVALMELHASRMAARLGPGGEPVPLLEQDRDRWDQELIRSGFAALLRAQRSDGPYVLQAAIAASHARARTAQETDWVGVAGLYELLVRRTPTPVVELNRAVAVAMAFGPERGLAIVDGLAGELRDYHLLPAVRGDLLRRLGRDAEARAEFARAASLARNAKERDVLLARAAM